MRAAIMKRLRFPGAAPSIGFVVTTVLANLAGGCHHELSAAAKTVPLPEALSALRKGIQQSEPAALSDGKSAVGLGSIIKDEIFRAQCETGMANPVIDVLSGQVSLQLQTNVTATGQATVTIGADPSLAAGGSVALADQRQITLPLTFVSAAGLPDLYVNQMLSSLTGLTPVLSVLSNDEQKALVHPFVKRLLEDRDALEAIVIAQVCALPSVEDCEARNITPAPGLKKAVPCSNPSKRPNGPSAGP
jgi:hypothetical protein